MAYGVYSDSGKIRVTEVSGSALTGIYAADGSINIVVDDSTYNGVYHPCGAYRVNSSAGTTLYDASGAYYYNHLLGPGSDAVGTPPTGDALLDFSDSLQSQYIVLIEDI
jgi:hypothetical protein